MSSGPVIRCRCGGNLAGTGHMPWCRYRPTTVHASDPIAPLDDGAASPPKIVHILKYGVALCGQPGIPARWPPEHRWVAFNDPDLISQATCDACKAAS